MPLPNEKSSVMDFPQPADAVIAKTQQTKFTNCLFVYINGINIHLSLLLKGQNAITTIITHIEPLQSHASCIVNCYKFGSEEKDSH